jgi:hypothetical protein
MQHKPSSALARELALPGECKEHETLNETVLQVSIFNKLESKTLPGY